MADRSTQILLEGLSRAVADSEGLPLHGSKASPGLFSGTQLEKQAAQRCQNEGYLRVLRTENRGKKTVEICTLTEKGLAFLVEQLSPRQVFEKFLRSLEARQADLSELMTQARGMQTSLNSLKGTAERILHHLGKTVLPGSGPSANGSQTWPNTVLSFLEHWQNSGSAEDCPLPTLFHQAVQACPGLTLGQFHDGLRRLHEEDKLYLHPWTGPLYDLPEPRFALLVGHEIAYYASIKEIASGP
jgi:hypothetical protein